MNILVSSADNTFLFFLLISINKYYVKRQKSILKLLNSKLSMNIYQILNFKKMSSKSGLTQILKSILEKNSELTGLAEDDEIFGKILSIISGQSQSDNPQSLPNFLAEECGIRYKDIMFLVNELINNSTSLTILGEKIMKLWLTIKIYETIDGFKVNSQTSAKRKSIQDVFKDYQFQGGNLESLIQASLKSAKEPFQKDDIVGIAEEFSARKPEEIKRLFAKKQIEAPKKQDIVNNEISSYNADKSADEQLTDLIADFKIFPEGSFEKLLQTELIWAHAIKFKLEDQIDKDLSFKSDLGQLKNTYTKVYGSLTSQIAELFTKLQGKNMYYQNLFTLKTKVFPINVLELQRLINKTDDAKKRIKGKEVIFVIGNTGSGKSTNILKFLGYTLYLGEYNGLKTLIPRQKLEEDHKTFYTSPEAKSCTRYINAVAVPDKMYPKGTPNNKKNLIICDSPGFGDSAGVEVDIANGVGMINALYEASSVRVVVILPYHSLLGDRMDGAIKMGEIISNLFYELTVLDSIKILFNKVPSNEIEQIFKKIENKLKHLTQTQKSNQKLSIFLNEILESSKDSDNFLDPMQDDYKKLFVQLFKMPPIRNVKQSFQYEFADSTKKQVEKFAQGEKSKVKDYFMAKKYEHAQFHLKMLEILKNILMNNEKLKVFYNELIQFIQKESASKFVQYEQFVTEIINCQSNASTEKKLKECKETIIQIHHLFHQFNGIQLVSEQSITGLVEEKKNKLLQQFADLSGLNDEIIIIVKTFSKILSPNLEQKASFAIDKSFSSTFQEIERLAKDKNYPQIKDKIQNLSILYKYTMQLSQTISSNSASVKMENLKKMLEEEVDDGIKTITQIINESPKLKAKMVNEANLKIQNIKQIESLKFLQNNPEIRQKLNRLLKQIQGICKKTVRELDNVRLTLNEEVQSNVNIEENQLSSKTKAIELLMKIDCIGENLKEDYDNAIENISRKLKESVQILRNGIAALKGNKTEEIYRNLQNIKKATAIVLRCSKIVNDRGDESSQLATSIQSEFMKFLKGQIQILTDFEVKLNRVPQQRYFQKIMEQCRKIQTYAKMGIIGDQVKKAVESIRKQFKVKLNTPLKEFLERQIITIQEKKSYKFLTYSLDKLQKLCTYLFQAEDNFSMEYRSEIKESQILIAVRLKPFFQAMQKDIANFLELQFSMSEHSPSLKDLIKILLAINAKKKTCQFLNLRVDFNIEDHINNIERKLRQIMEHLENRYNNHAKAAELQAIYESCKYYSEIEQCYKQSFGFKQLQKQCSLAFTKSLQNDEDRIRILIKGISPTKLSFADLKIYYEQFRTLKGQGAKKRRFIIDELRVVEKNCQNDLIRFKKEMDDPNFVNKDDFLKAFQQANVLVKQLNELYTEEEDKKSILIQKEDIKKIGIKIISVFQSKFEIVYNQIMDQNINNVEQNLKSFGSLEAMIYDAFPLETMMEQNHQEITKIVGKEDEKDETKLIIFVLDNVRLLKAMIETHKYLKDEKLNAKNTKRLKVLLDYLRKGTQNFINQKYNTVSTMQFTSAFQKYYSSCNKQQKLDLIGKINQKMDILFQQYKDKIIESGDAAQSLSKDIVTSFNYLPSEISSNRRKEFINIKQSLTNSFDSEINNAVKYFSENPAKSKDLFIQSRLAMKKNQNGIHQKYVQKFGSFFGESNFKVLPLKEKFDFINTYIIKVLQDNKTYFREDLVMFNSLDKMFSQHLQQLIKEEKDNLKAIRQFIEDIQTQQKETYFQRDITNIFKIYTFIISIKDDLLGEQPTKKKADKSKCNSITLNLKQFKENFAGEYQAQIIEIGKQFIINVGKRPSEKINSTDILDNSRMKKVQAYIQYLKKSGLIIDHIKRQIDIFERLKINRPGLKRFEKVDFGVILKQYEIQMRMMYKFCDGFQFYTQQKRNWPPKIIEEDIKSLDINFRILTERKEFFKKDVISQNHQNYNFDGIKAKIKQRFERLVSSSKSEIKQTFQSYYGDPATKVNLLVTQLQAMDKKQLKFIESDIVKEIHEEVKEMVRSQSAKICTKASQQFNELKVKLDDLSKKVLALETDKNTNIKKENDNFDTQFTTKKKDTEDNFNPRINLQKTEDKKTQLINAMKAQINSIKKDLNDIKVKNIAKIQSKYSVQLQSYNQSISPVIEAYTQSVKIAKRSLLDLCIQVEKRTQMAQKLFVGVDKLKTKYVRMIQNSFEKDVKDQRSIGKQILTSQKTFRHYQATLFSRLIMGQDIQYVVKYLQRININGRQKMTKVELDNIKFCYGLFKKRYDELKDKYKAAPTDTTINYMIQPLQTLGKQIKTEFYFNSSPAKSVENKINLLAGIFALWAILKSQVFQGQVEFTIEPHPTQITTLILLLGISQPNEQLADRLAQVGTGQGKSIVLAGLSSYLALVGFKVRCACYSEYLSGRDQQSFKILFSRLGIQNEIKYGTFHELCEDVLNSGGSNLKQSVQKMLLQPPKGILQSIANAFGGNLVKLNKGANQIQDNPTILVIDEVDVFFDDSYFGKNYCPGIKLKDSTVSAMLQHVWKEVSQKQKDIEPDSFLDSQHFKNLVEKYPTLKDLLKNQVHGMVSGALNCNHEYVIVNQKIGYKDGDSISFKINYGYKTVFANLLEHGRGKISRQSLDESLHICLMIAEFSYAKLPVYFNNILGVTGTLEVLPKYKKEQLASRYKINDQFAIPSAFGIEKRRIEDYIITSKENFYQSIINKINQVQHNRPMIIFFKGPRELNQFYVHPLFEKYQTRANSLTEEHDPFTRDSRIVRAVEPKNITLMTNSFGRGTDFVLLDDNIKKNGGLHVLQAFLSLDESQEVQIKGRTARQSGLGSYDCTISENWLEQLDLTPQDIPKNATSDMIHSILLKARESTIAKQAVSTLNALKLSDELHEKTVNIFAKPKLAQSDLIDYVSILNKLPEIRKIVIKTILGLDATGSMSAGLKRTCQIIGNAFTETYAVLNKEKVQATIEIKIMVYRNYNSPKEQILQSTTFENTPVNLKSFLERVGPKGGWGNEALQVMFQSLNKEKKIDQVILIGDAAPNTVNDVQYKRKERGTDYWNTNGFQPTHIDKEIAEFANKNCPVHSFYLNNGEGFKQISAKTHGQAAPFKINSPTVTKDLSQFVVTNILKLVEKNSGSAGLNLVEAYKKMFA